jgi:hypothetical protein
MPGHGPARPGTPSHPDGAPQHGKNKERERWIRVPARDAAMLRVLVALVVLSIVALTIMTMRLAPAARSANSG